MSSSWLIAALLGLAACDGRARGASPSPSARPVGNVSPSVPGPSACPTLPIRLGGSEGFVDCVKGEPSQYEYPECFTYWFDLVPDRESICPPQRLLLWVMGWPQVRDRYEVELRADGTTATTSLVLRRPPDGPLGPRGPAPGHPGEILGRIRTVDGKFTEFLPGRIVRSYQPDEALPRRAL